MSHRSYLADAENEPVVQIGPGRFTTIGFIESVTPQRDRDPSIRALFLNVVVASRLGLRRYVFGTVEQRKILEASGFDFSNTSVVDVGEEILKFDWSRIVGRRVWMEIDESSAKPNAHWVGLVPEDDK